MPIRLIRQSRLAWCKTSMLFDGYPVIGRTYECCQYTLKGAFNTQRVAYATFWRAWSAASYRPCLALRSQRLALQGHRHSFHLQFACLSVFDLGLFFAARRLGPLHHRADNLSLHAIGPHILGNAWPAILRLGLQRQLHDRRNSGHAKSARMAFSAHGSDSRTAFLCALGCADRHLRVALPGRPTRIRRSAGKWVAQKWISSLMWTADSGLLVAVRSASVSCLFASWPRSPRSAKSTIWPWGETPFCD